MHGFHEVIGGSVRNLVLVFALLVLPATRAHAQYLGLGGMGYPGMGYGGMMGYPGMGYGGVNG